MESGYLLTIWVVVTFLFILILALVCCRACMRSEANSVRQTSGREGYTSEEEEEDDKDKILDEKFKLQSMYPSLRERRLKLKDRKKSFPVLPPVTPTAPPPYEGTNPEGRTMPPPNNSLHHSVWRQVHAELIPSGMGPKVLMSFPVFLDQAGNQFHEPLDFKTVKQIADSVRTYGVAAAFTLTQVESLTRHAMTPWDWSNLVRACMAPGQFLVWNGPDPVLAWAWDAVCIFPQTHQDPIWVPEQLVCKINQPPKDNDINTYDEPPDDTHGDDGAPCEE